MISFFFLANQLSFFSDSAHCFYFNFERFPSIVACKIRQNLAEISHMRPESKQNIQYPLIEALLQHLSRYHVWLDDLRGDYYHWVKPNDQPLLKGASPFQSLPQHIFDPPHHEISKKFAVVRLIPNNKT